MKTKVILWIMMLVAIVSAEAKVSVIASTQDLAAIATEIGGTFTNVEYICKGASNPHSVELLPSYMMKVSRAQLYLKVGLGLDFWANPIIDGSRNNHLKVIDCSEHVSVLDVPVGKVDASMGDVHPEGNPHYWLDPENGKVIAANIRDGLIAVDPANASSYRSSYTAFETKLTTKIQSWKQTGAVLKGKKIVTFHHSWPYFAKAFGLDVVGYVEPKPGIEPTPSHTAELIKIVKAQQVSLICREPYFSDKAPNSIAAMTGARSMILYPSVGGEPSIKTYFDLFDRLVTQLTTTK